MDWTLCAKRHTLQPRAGGIFGAHQGLHHRKWNRRNCRYSGDLRRFGRAVSRKGAVQRIARNTHR